MQADISAYLKGLLKTLNPKILKAIIVLIEAGKINPFHFLLLCYPSLKTKKKQKKTQIHLYSHKHHCSLFSPFHSRHFKNTCAIHRELLSKRQPCLGKAV